MASLRRLSGNPDRIFVVGDIHGCNDELACLLDHLFSKENLSEKDQLIFIGDYIDRGPNAWAVVDRLLLIKRQFPHTVFLKGNHEDMLLDFLGYKGRMGEAFLDNGGASTLFSYGIRDITSPESVKRQFPENHRDFFTSLTDYASLQEYIFVHAGVNRAVPLEEQGEEDLFWIRDEFIMYPHTFKKMIVFGHTPYHEVMLHLPYKIGIDTGLVYGNKLTCMELKQRKLFQIHRGHSIVIEDDLQALFPIAPRGVAA